jgi:tetratricopeptide (TPR) repeat protein
MRNLAGVYHMKSEYAEAASVLQRALELEPDASTWTNLGTARFFQGRFGDAVKAMEKATELNPKNYLYWGNLGDAYRWAPGEQAKAAGAYARAIQLARDSLAVDPGDKVTRSRLAVYLGKSGDMTAALAEIGKLKGNTNPGVLFKIAIVQELAHHRAQALDALERAIKGGYSMHEITNEPELAALRSDDRYRKIAAAGAGRNQ